MPQVLQEVDAAKKESAMLAECTEAAAIFTVGQAEKILSSLLSDYPDQEDSPSSDSETSENTSER